MIILYARSQLHFIIKELMVIMEARKTREQIEIPMINMNVFKVDILTFFLCC